MKPQSHRIAALTSVLILVLAPGARGQCPGGSFHQMNSLLGLRVRDHGLAFDAVCIDSLDLNTGTMACLSPPLRYTVY